MKPILSILLFLFAIHSQAQTTVKTLTHNGVERSYRVHLPPNFDINDSLSLVLNYHGIGSNAQQQELYSAFSVVADSANFIVVYPEGLVDTLASGQIIRHWNCYFGSDSDDVGFTDVLIDSLHQDYNINLRRVYSTGMSNGGFMSYMLACELSDRIAAIASVTGALSFPQQENCTPSRAVPVMQIHGTSDETVSYDGEADFYGSAPEAVDYWVNFNNCMDSVITQEIPDIDTNDDCTASLEIFGGCDENTEVQFYTIDGGGHTWPGAFNFVGSITNQDFKASGVIWDFFNRFELPLPMDTVIIDTMVVDTMIIDTMVMDTMIMDTMVMDTMIMDTMVMDTMIMDTMVMDTTIVDTTEGSVGVENLEHLLRFYPNPCKDYLNIEWENESVLSIELIDVNGKVSAIFSGNENSFSAQLATSELEVGLYFLRIETKNGVIVEKVLKE